MNSKYERFLDSFTLPNGISLKNRIVMASMTNFSSNEDRSFPIRCLFK